MSNKGFFCPIIKDACLQAKCVMWDEGACVIVTWLRCGVDAGSVEFSESAAPRASQDYENDEDYGKIELPYWLISKTPFEAATGAIEHALSDRDDGEIAILNTETTFLIYMNEKVNGYVDEDLLTRSQAKWVKQFKMEIEKMLRPAIEKEIHRRQVLFPTYLDELVQLAKDRALNRYTQADIEAFCRVKGDVATWRFCRHLWSAANARLKGLI